MSLTEALLRPLAQVKPLITHYDDAAGTRQELSVATAANWAAKTANWLVEEHDVEPGTRLAVQLPPHWQTAGILLGAWWAGAHVVAEPEDAALTFVAPGNTAPGLVAAVSLDPMGRDLGGTKDGVVDFVGESRLFGDDFFGSPVSGDTPALAGLTVDEVLARAKDVVEPGARVLSTIDWSVPDGVLRALVAPLAAGGSVVQVTGVDETKLDAKRTSERTTTDLF
ncbi:TIGR03089 family protein [Actinokineospora pegani]|uniref:TIGR03089 family protein n=1 Tax=Actinokineospora pegani TaxID=2654637 RepID=UPI0012E9E438|nr:TIGR03089 family protein [Actinokineospora pegani]